MTAPAAPARRRRLWPIGLAVVILPILVGVSVVP
jgi:hypothetical protein